LTRGARRRAIRQIQTLLAGGASDDEVREHITTTLNLSTRSANYYLATAYAEMASAAEVDRRHLVGLALKQRRIAAKTALRDGDIRAYLAACESQSRLLGLDAPQRTQHTVLIDQARGLSAAVIFVVKDYFADDPVGRERFSGMLRARLNAQLSQRPDKVALVIDAGDEGEVVESSDARAIEVTADVSSTRAPTPDVPPPA
jgi:hypothetical protein